MPSEADPEELDGIRFAHEEDGSITATDSKTGLARGGRTRSEALANLAEALTLEEGDGESIDDPEEFLRGVGVNPDTDDESTEDLRYVPDSKTQYLWSIRELTEDHSPEELRKEIAEIQDEIDAWKSEFDVENRDGLEATLTEEDLSGDEVRRRNRVLRQWECNGETKTLLRHVLSLYDDLTDLEDEPMSFLLT